MSKAKIGKEQYEDIVEMYKNGFSQASIAKQYDVSQSAIRDIIKKCNASSLGTAYRVFNSKEDEVKICDMYLSGQSTVKIAKQYSCDHHVIERVLKKYGINRRHRHYQLNENYFDDIYTPNQAYILGFLYADGYNNIERSVVTLSLQERDRDILEKMRKEINSEKPLVLIDAQKYYDGKNSCQNQYSMILRSAHMCKALEDKGVYQAKSLILQWPTFLRDDLYSHFLRGYIDGDGHIAPKKYQYRVEFLGTYDFCTMAKNYIENKLGIICSVKYANCNNGVTSNLYVRSRENVIKFLNYIYQDADLYLERKYNTYISKYCTYDNINNTLTA